MALIKIKQINNSPAAVGGAVMFDGTNNVWSNNDDGAIQLSAGITGQRPTGVNGMIRYNSTLGCIEGFISGIWVCLTSDSDFETDQIFGADGQLSEPIIFITDTTRSNKKLSSEVSNFVWNEDFVSDNDWLQVPDVTDTDSGYIMPYAGTVIRATGHTENNNGDIYEIDLYINETDNGAVVSLGSSSTGQHQDENTNLNIDFSAGDKLRLKAEFISGSGNGDSLGDTVVTLWTKWRIGT